jgi:hypothetical protein
MRLLGWFQLGPIEKAAGSVGLWLSPRANALPSSSIRLPFPHREEARAAQIVGGPRAGRDLKSDNTRNRRFDKLSMFNKRPERGL